MNDQPSIEAFVDECELFLSARYPRTRAVERPFVWGEGPDRTDLFDETDAATEAAAVQAARSWRKDLAEHRLSWITGPEEFGGRALPVRYQRAFDDIARRYEVAGNTKLTVSLGVVAPTILAHGTADTKQRTLRPLHAGILIACQLFSEPDAGSDLASVTTTAARVDGGWRVTGQKVWTSGAHYSDIGEVLCRTSDGPRHRNLTAMLVDMRSPGVEVRPLRQMTGGAAFNEVFLSDVFVPDVDVLGDVGGGWQVAMTTLASERNSLGGEGFGGTGLLSADRYRQMLQAVGEAGCPVARQRFAELSMHLRIAKYTRQRAAADRARGAAAGHEAIVAKMQLAANYRRITDFVGAVLGARLTADSGEWGTYAWNGFVLGSPSMSIAGGTDEVLKNVLAERALGLPRA